MVMDCQIPPLAMVGAPYKKIVTFDWRQGAVYSLARRDYWKTHNTRTYGPIDLSFLVTIHSIFRGSSSGMFAYRCSSMIPRALWR